MRAPSISAAVAVSAAAVACAAELAGSRACRMNITADGICFTAKAYMTYQDSMWNESSMIQCFWSDGLK